MSAISSFKNIENKHDVYRGKDCMEKFCKSLTEHAMKIINFKKKKKKINVWKIKNTITLEVIVIKQEHKEFLCIAYVYGFYYDYHFIRVSRKM